VYPYDASASGWNKLRYLTMERVVRSKAFDIIILAAIMANCVFLAMDNPNLTDDDPIKKAGNVAEWVFLVIFTVEMLAKWVALGFFSPWKGEPKKKELWPGGYFKVGMCVCTCVYMCGLVVTSR
jgi:hypothetical protein